MSWLDTFSEIRATDWSKAEEAEREAKAREVVTITGYASAAAAVVPVPLVDIALLLPFHSAMVVTVGHVFGRPLSDTEAKRLALELTAVAGVTVGARAAITALKKVLLPGIGGVLAAPASFAVTWALGRVTIEYFKDPELSRDELRKVFKEAFSDAGRHFSKEAFDRFRKKESEPDEAEGVTTPEPPDESPNVDSAASEPASAEETPPSVEPAPAEPSEEPPSERPSVRPKKRSL